MFRAAVRRAEQAGKAVGVVTALVGFPAAMFGAWTFGSEIRDTVTAPDITVDIRNMTLRCFYRITSQADYVAYVDGDQSVLTRYCRAAPLAVSFEAVITNGDSIARTLTAISARLDLPPGSPAVAPVFAQSWLVTHTIDGLRETNLRESWSVTRLPPGASVTQEVWLVQDLPGDEQAAWSELLDWIMQEENPPEHAEIATTVTLSIAGQDEPVDAATCRFMRRPESLERFRSFDPWRQIQFTGACASD
ncbi:hypothetical protein [Pontivivens ytuae]|uniref:Uncharacterized protein n=1 Tax=Pontivivens ytuae TaxID=2789856 RepID=A0A7S9LUM9_9RHOB|nr:hypothetical protein [Pontivivens ytuae]QPH55572.1 hypothetical protein I0K15_07515 [Pontivivens ytuae]